MKSRTVCLPPGRVVPGMSLASPILAHDGQVLLAAGAVLDGEILERLIRRGIEAVFVAVLDMRDADTIGLETEASRARVDYIFRGPGSPARETLRATILQYRLEQAQ